MTVGPDHPYPPNDNKPCEVCGGNECPPEWHVEVMTCPVCKSDFDEFSGEPFNSVMHELIRRADRRRDKRQFANELADWLEQQAEYAATKSRDFGRGFMLAVKVLRGYRS